MATTSETDTVTASPPGGATTGPDRQIGDLVKDLTEQTSRLVRQEIELARIELAEKGKHVGIGAGMLGGAGLLGLFAFAALTAAFILLLAEVMPAWLAALIVTVAYAAVAGVLALTGRGQLRRATPLKPERTVGSVQQDIRLATDRAREARQ